MADETRKEVKEEAKSPAKKGALEKSVTTPRPSRTHGRTFTGTVVSDKMSRTVTVEWARRHYDRKYQRYEKRRTRVKAHNPDEMDAKTGDKVTIIETRPLSKTKRFVVIKKES